MFSRPAKKRLDFPFVVDKKKVSLKLKWAERPGKDG